MRKFATFCAMAALATFSVGGVKAEEQVMTKDQIEKLYRDGLQIQGNIVSPSGWQLEFVILYKGDGTMSGTNNGGQANSGTWSIGQNGEICQEWKDARWGTGCSFVVKTDNAYIKLEPGSGTRKHYDFKVLKEG